MRIMQVIYSFGIGGSEFVARDIALNLNGGTTHAVAALEFDGPMNRILAKKGVETYVIDKQAQERIGPMIRLFKAMKKFKPDVVHTHHLYELFYAWPGALLTGARIIHTEHEYFSLMTNKAKILLRVLSYFCDAITGVNDETSEYLEKMIGIPRRKIHTVVNGIDLECYRSDKDLKGWALRSDEDRVAAMVARLVPVKDHAMLLKAFRLVVEKMPQAKLWIIGDGPQRKELEKTVEGYGLKSHVLFLGERTDVPSLLNRIDVAVLSSREEGLPLSILEAMAAGKAVVATNVGGISKVVTQGLTGLLVSRGDATGMAKALFEVLTDNERRERLGSSGRKMIETQYALNKNIQSYYSLYSSE